MIAYQRKPLVKNRSYFINRKIEPSSEVLVKVEDIVYPETIILRGWQQSGYRTFDLSSLFGTDVEKIGQALVKTIGSRVYKGDIIAKFKQWFGLREKLFRSPVEGIISDYQADQAKLTIQYFPTEIKVTSGFFGKVTEILPGDRLGISTYVNTLRGVVAFGIEREGSLVEVGYSDIPLQADQINYDHAGKIIFGGTKVTLDVLYKALTVGVKAIITGGIDYHDIAKLYGTKGRFEDIGISILVSEGFGSLSIYSPLYEFLKQNEHRHAFFVPQDKELVIPISSEFISPEQLSSLNIEDTSKQETEKSYVLVAEGQKARILSDRAFGQYGIVSGLLPDSEEVKLTYPEGEIKLNLGDVEIITE